MDRPRIYVDFNEMPEPDLVLLSKSDRKADSEGNLVALREGMSIHVYMDDRTSSGEPDNLIADGVVERNASAGWAAGTPWCVRIDSRGIRHESDSTEPDGG